MEEERKRGIHMENPRQQQLRGTRDGLMLAALVDDFLQFYGLAFTRSTFDAEVAAVAFHIQCSPARSTAHMMDCVVVLSAA